MTGKTRSLGKGENVEQYTLENFQYAKIEQDVWNEMKKVQLRVLTVLEESKEARNSYAVLVSNYWEKQLKHKGLKKTPFMMTDEEKRQHLRSPESITRAYRKLQEMDGIQFASDETQKKRNEREEGFRQAMGKNKGLDGEPIWKGENAQ